MRLPKVHEPQLLCGGEFPELTASDMFSSVDKVLIGQVVKVEFRREPVKAKFYAHVAGDEWIHTHDETIESCNAEVVPSLVVTILTHEGEKRFSIGREIYRAYLPNPREAPNGAVQWLDSDGTRTSGGIVPGMNLIVPVYDVDGLLSPSVMPMASQDDDQLSFQELPCWRYSANTAALDWESGVRLAEQSQPDPQGLYRVFAPQRLEHYTAFCAASVIQCGELGECPPSMRCDENQQCHPS